MPGRCPLPVLKESIAPLADRAARLRLEQPVLEQHDLPRIVSRWGDDGACRVDSAKALAVVLHGLQGTPYIYQGEELGMTNAPYPLADLRDIESLNAYQEMRDAGKTDAEAMAAIHRMGRDNARTPMQWTAGENAGFTTGTPWLRVNPNHTEINAEAALADPDSVFYTYQKLIALRKCCPVFAEGDFTLLCPQDDQVFAYTAPAPDSSCWWRQPEAADPPPLPRPGTLPGQARCWPPRAGPPTACCAPGRQCFTAVRSEQGGNP